MTEEEITDRIAEEIAERIGDRELSPRFLEAVVHLYTLQAVGELPPPGNIRMGTLADALGVDRHTVSASLRTGLCKCWQAYHRDFPELLP